MIEVKVRLGEKWWRIVGVYINNVMERKLEELKKWTEERVENTRVLIEEDFDARTGTKTGRVKKVSWKEETEKERLSWDKKINREGKRLYKFLEE